jgi:hypothetical protein
MTQYRVRMLDSVSGAEGTYAFEHRDDLMARPADDVIAAFFEYADRAIFNREHVEYELNGAVKNKKQKTVVAIGSLQMSGDATDDDRRPFTIFISAV